MAKIRYRWRVYPTGRIMREKRPYPQALPAAPGMGASAVAFLFRDSQFQHYTLASKDAAVYVAMGLRYVCYYNFPTKEAAVVFQLMGLAKE